MTGIIDIGTLKHETFSRRFAIVVCHRMESDNGVYPHLPFTSPVVYCYTTKTIIQPVEQNLYDSFRVLVELLRQVQLESLLVSIDPFDVGLEKN
jgi:hypothetical protein